MIERGLTIDELAARSGVPSRTIRFYQTKGALPPPRREGRVAYYGPEHARRLEVIAALQDRGLRLSAISDLLRRSDGDALSVGEWLGVGDELGRPWSEDRPQLLAEGEVVALVAGHPAGTLAGLVSAGILERRAETLPATYLVPSPALLAIALDLLAAGIPLEQAAAAQSILAHRLGQAAAELVAHFAGAIEADLGTDGPAAVARTLGALRPQAERAVVVMFAHAIERALAEVVASGGRPPARPRPSRSGRISVR